MAHVNLNNLRTSENFLQGQCIAVQLKSDMSCVICNMSIDTEKAHDGMITCVKCGNSSLLLCGLVAHITVKMSEQCFNDALWSLVNTTHTPRPLCDIPLDELKKLILKSGPKEILADKSTQVIAQFFPLRSILVKMEGTVP